jgi:ABC-type uncharacterized transport system substrate-binding protein
MVRALSRHLHGAALAAVATLAVSAPVCADAASVVVIKNAAAPVYDEPARAVLSALKEGNTLTVIELGEANLAAAKARAAQIRARNPDLVIALGDKAAFLADRELGPTPVVFGMVANWEGLGLSAGRTTGVSMELEPETMASQIKLLLPKVQRVGVVYTRKSKPFVERAMQRSATLELTLIPVFVSDAAEFPRAMSSQIGFVDLYWLVDDPTIITAENVKLLMDKARESRVVTLCASPRLVAAGLTMSIAVEPKVVGAQMAELAQAVLSNPTAPRPPVATPDQAKITMNRQEIERLGLQIDPALLSFVDVIDTGGASAKGRASAPVSAPAPVSAAAPASAPAPTSAPASQGP